MDLSWTRCVSSTALLAREHTCCACAAQGVQVLDGKQQQATAMSVMGSSAISLPALDPQGLGLSEEHCAVDPMAPTSSGFVINGGGSCGNGELLYTPFEAQEGGMGVGAGKM